MDFFKQTESVASAVTNYIWPRANPGGSGTVQSKPPSLCLDLIPLFKGNWERFVNMLVGLGKDLEFFCNQILDTQVCLYF